MSSHEHPAEAANSQHVAQAASTSDYEQLRNRLAQLNSAPVKDMRAIDEVISRLEKAQLAYKATFGLIGNNPNDD